MEHLIKVNVIVPAFNEESVISSCLSSIAKQSYGGPRQIIISANGCRDNTVSIAQFECGKLEKLGWKTHVIETELPSKTNALNRADSLVEDGIRVYLDADIICAEHLLEQIVKILDFPEPRFASGSMGIATGDSTISKLYASVWKEMPFHRRGVPGAGLFAVNDAGRKRWAQFPDIIADDFFVRLHFSPKERHKTLASYCWPLPNGLCSLVRTRARQEYGNLEITQRFPSLLTNEDNRGRGELFSLARIFFRNPIGFSIYLFVRSSAFLFRYVHSGKWERDR